ncbi:MAG: hypothetical protein F2842_11810 [Actinobacteria bacterium]|uniref:Unannotated protein n=1 Tax=freshwater metagenome TaxID=449393 RepID=A0A6J7LCG6_9ZZZZ|nr:hypothetical protein [Actinomycetota bacterium]
MRTLRVVLLSIIGVAAVAITLLMAPAPPTISVAKVSVTVPPINASSYASDIQTALSNGEANNSNAEGAPQQTVVNGWTARDLLAVIGAQLDEQNASVAKTQDGLAAVAEAVSQASAAQTSAVSQLAAAPIDRRPALLLMLAVLAIVVIGATLPAGPAPAGPTAPTAAAAPPLPAPSAPPIL